MRFCFAGFSHKRNHQLFLQEIEEEEGKYKVSFLNFKYTLQNSNFIELMVFYSFNIWQSSFELKNEENLKLKERLDLEKVDFRCYSLFYYHGFHCILKKPNIFPQEIASLRATFDEQNLRNQKLKRIKVKFRFSLTIFTVIRYSRSLLSICWSHRLLCFLVSA